MRANTHSAITHAIKNKEVVIEKTPLPSDKTDNEGNIYNPFCLFGQAEFNNKNQKEQE